MMLIRTVLPMLAVGSLGHECKHDKLDFSITTDREPDEASSRERKMSALAVGSMRVKYAWGTSCEFAGDTTTSCYCKSVGESVTNGADTVTCTQEMLVDSAKMTFIEEIMDEAIEWLEAVFSVERVVGPLSVGSGTHCGVTAPAGAGSSQIENGVAIPSDDKTNGVADADLVLYLSAIDVTDSSTLAWAVPCHAETSVSRPLVGQVNFNPTKFNAGEIFDTREASKQIVIHEIFHVMGFSKTYFDRLDMLDANEKFINTPTVIEKARAHFDCSDLEGLGTENQGSASTAGSHWEQKTMGYEAMVGTLTTGYFPAVSDMTLALFEDTNFYTVNYNKADKFWWGKNEGCDFAVIDDTSKCGTGTSDEFCMKDDQGNSWASDALQACISTGGVSPCRPGICTHTLLARGFCNIANYTSAVSFPHFAENTLGGSLSSTDFCPIAGSIPNFRFGQGPCRSEPPGVTLCSSITDQTECTNSDYYCVFNNGNCVDASTNVHGSTFGLNSRCFVTNNLINTNFGNYAASDVGGCFKTVCNPADQTYTIEVHNMAPIECTGTVTPGGAYSRTIECWEYDIICNGRGGVLAALGTDAPTLVPGSTKAPDTPPPPPTLQPTSVPETPQPPPPPTTPVPTPPTACSAQMISRNADCLVLAESACESSTTCTFCSLGAGSGVCLYTQEACGSFTTSGINFIFHTVGECPTVEGAAALMPGAAILFLLLLTIF
ncbi:Leishmanolysin-like protein [Diplonema papillatum]|nr:Leishmanolysin-like protein [Diplonema papillatum]